MNETDIQLMIDLETLGLLSDSVILSIGVVQFNFQGKLEALFHKGISIQSCLSAGLKVDGNTIEWWLSQKNENIAKVAGMIRNNTHPLLGTVLTELRMVAESIGDPKTLYVWSHGSNFDLVILENAYKAIGSKAWWNYRNVRDTRTLFDLANYTYKAGGEHDALNDAMNQAEAVQQAYQQLMRRGDNGSNG